ncbi:MAG: hypothetical protein PHC39_04625 [Proteiniphilum sp.]|nr:hypothetical protein [Proteiniphilum sp.]
MVIKREATRQGRPGHIVHVQASDRFVAKHYPGTDPRTKARKR